MKNPLVALLVGILIGVGGLYFSCPMTPCRSVKVRSP